MKIGDFASLLASTLLTLLLLPRGLQAHSQQSNEHSTGVEMRGDHAMGFSHETTAHHFRLLKDGGIIEVDVLKPGDEATRDKIRMHLSHIAAMFSANNFDVPMFIHDREPPGVSTMKQRHDSIAYTYQSTDLGAEVRITTEDAKALQAVHDFLRFQIQDHRTGDPITVQ